MLSTEQIGTLAAMSGITADVLATAISDEQEVKLELPEGRFLSTENEQKLIDNTAKKKYDEGKNKGSKEVLESVKTNFSLEGDSMDDLLGNFKANILKDANLEPNEKLAEKDNAIKALQDSLKNKESEIETFKSDMERTQRQAKALSSMPKLREDLGLKKEEALNIILSNVEVKEDGIYKNGNLVVDSYQSAIGLEDFLSQETTERGWVEKKIQGNGGRKPGYQGAEPKTYEEFQKVCESKGWNEGSLQAKEYLKTLKSKNPDFEI